MKNKLMLLSGAAVGYVLGTRAGREQYEKIRSQALSLWKDPRVQEQVSTAQQVVKEKAPEVQHKVTDAVRKNTGDTGDSSPSRSEPASDPYVNPGGGI
jgi:hypothetical protein